MKKFMSMVLQLLFGHMKIDPNKIIFETGNYKPEDNPYAIYQYLKQNYPERYRTIWFVKKGLDFGNVDPNDIVYYRTWKYFYHLSTAHIWIRSHSVGSMLKKRKDQIYIQTWHGGGAFKKCGYDVSDAKERPPVDHVKEWDYFIATDPYNASMIKTSCGYNKNVKILGLPRSDVIVNATASDIETLRKKIIPQIEKNKKIILYAPTFRENELENKKVNLPIQQLSSCDEYVILVRLHPYVRSYLDLNDLADNMINVSQYPNVQDLLLISDCLITDYSSIIFDYSILERPIIFYTYDYEDYMQERSGFYLDYETDLPGIRIDTQAKLLKNLLDYEHLCQNCEKQLRNFNEKYNKLNDGSVCERVVEFIQSL